jgi:hypothetical protein
MLSTPSDGSFVSDGQSLQQWARNSVGLMVAEFAVVAALFLADVRHPIYVSRTPYLFLLGWPRCGCAD